VLPSEYAQDAGRLLRFEQEARAAGALNHPNVLTVFEAGRQDGTSYLVFELLEGETLRTRLTRARSRLDAPWSTPRRSRAASPPRTSAASCTATSSRRTCSSPVKAG
jgi:serine/threonine protein kinase